MRVDLKSPRRRLDPGFAELRRRLLAQLGVEDDDESQYVSGVRDRAARPSVDGAPAREASGRASA